MKLVEPLKKSSRKTNPQPPDYSSWDALTQAKYLYDLRMATGEPITMAQAYEMAEKSILDINEI